jgi:hypothetical protein
LNQWIYQCHDSGTKASSDCHFDKVLSITVQKPHGFTTSIGGLLIGKLSMIDRTEALIYFRHWYGVRKAPRFGRTSPLKLNLGCGSNHKQGWVDIDLFSSSADLRLDLRKRWPFPNGSATHI